MRLEGPVTGPALRLGRDGYAPSRLVAARTLQAFVSLLRFDAERGDRPGFETLQRDRLTGLLAVAVGTFFDRLQRRVDLGDQLAEAVARAQLQRTVGLGGGAIGEIGLRQALFLHVLQCLV